ncbi:MAG: histidine kinase [Burkholderiaceae bacterium]|nr:histidine kinase [Burkholderiaceae bacterium]
MNDVPRAWVWVPLLIGWLPVWVLFTVLFMSVHQEPWQRAAPLALRQMLTAALLGLVVHRLTARLPWPYPFRLRFVAIHALCAAGYAVAWLLFNGLIDSIRHGRPVLNLGPGAVPYLITGVWFYVMIAGVGYANRTAERAAQIAMLEARSQLAALRMQLQPHFLFNALHTVVQLIPIDPRGAVRATEQLAGLLRTTIEEQRDLVPLQAEWAFVQRYLAIEGIRFGERLVLRSDIDAAALACKLPSFALQTLVENAVRHAAAPSVEPTTLQIAARLDGGQLCLSVADDGPGADPAQLERGAGTGLRRLRERLAWLYGDSARLQFRNNAPHGLMVELTLPQLADDDE